MQRGRRKTQAIDFEVTAWDRQPEETGKAYTAFCAYRDMGRDRSLKKTVEQLGYKGWEPIRTWSSKFEWVERCSQYDAYLDGEARKLREKDILEMRDRHAKLATAMLAKAARALQKIPEDEIKPQDVSRMVEVAYKLERLARGETTEIVDGKMEHTGKDGGPIQTESSVVFYIPENGRE